MRKEFRIILGFTIRYLSLFTRVRARRACALSFGLELKSWGYIMRKVFRIILGFTILYLSLFTRVRARRARALSFGLELKKQGILCGKCSA